MGESFNKIFPLSLLNIVLSVRRKRKKERDRARDRVREREIMTKMLIVCYGHIFLRESQHCTTSFFAMQILMCLFR